MKPWLRLLLTGIAVTGYAHAQDLPALSGWGAIETPRELIPEQEQLNLWQAMQANVQALRAQGTLTEAKADLLVRFSWPTRFASGRPGLLDHTVAYYIDQDPAVNSVKDFACGARTYDTAEVGGGHKGTDIGVGLRGFYKMDTEQVIVVAAAPGTIVAKDDTHPDRSCGDLTTLFANTALKNNVISLRHADGSFGIYYHVKTGSLTAKKIGDTVVEGEYLAAVGSAGFSTSPHLHFEVRRSDNTLVDPWAGACNPTTGVSLWKSQEAYHVKEIMELMPTAVAPSAANLGPACTDNVAESQPASGYLQPDWYVQPGATRSYVAFLRDAEPGDAIVLSLRRPDGSDYATVTISAAAYFSSSYYYTNRSISASEPAGKWSFAATYAGKTQSVPFYFKVPAPAAARVYEFYNADLNHYFRTAAPEEAQSLTPASGFRPTGGDFYALDRAVTLAGVSPVCRFYGSVNPGPNSHFYTADPAECASLKSIQAQTPASLPRWNYEETAFAAYLPAGGLCPGDAPFPVYRLYNQHSGEIVAGKRQDSNHRFTTFSSVYAQMGMNGWRNEGTVMCAQTIP
jgi:murein DD-endopeptidase MepM/ murein hydrolase activator NlpD